MTGDNSDSDGCDDDDDDGDEHQSRALRQGSSSLRTALMIGQVLEAISADSRSGSYLVAKGGKCQILRFHKSDGSAASA